MTWTINNVSMRNQDNTRLRYQVNCGAQSLVTVTLAASVLERSNGQGVPIVRGFEKLFHWMAESEALVAVAEGHSSPCNSRPI
jgi:hypothetical protein